jgi:hypothetical protein
MKQRIPRMIILAGAVLALAACATGSGSNLGDEALNGSELLADEVMMVATGVWGDAVQVAEFYPGVEWQGVEAIEAELPYGETALAYQFTGFEPNEQLYFAMDVNIDTFMTDTFVEVDFLPGLHGADAGIWPRPFVEERIAFKWIDSVGRFAGSEWPDATNGWERITSTDLSADENGDFTVLVIVNHWTETPPTVYHYFTNPLVRSIQEGDME